MIFPDDTPDEVMVYIDSLCARCEELAVALLKYGMHDPRCDSSQDCTCGFSDARAKAEGPQSNGEA